MGAGLEKGTVQTFGPPPYLIEWILLLRVDFKRPTIRADVRPRLTTALYSLLVHVMTVST